VCSLVQNRINLGASFGQVPDKFQTSFGQVRTSFVLKLVHEREVDLYYLFADILVYVSWYKTGQIWEQAPDKFLTSSG
jgi:hypothetical protein